MANVRIVLIKKCEVVRDEPMKQAGEVLIVSPEAARDFIKKGYAVLNSDFTESMLPNYKKPVQKEEPPAPPVTDPKEPATDSTPATDEKASAKKGA